MSALKFNQASESDISKITDILTDATQYKLKQGDSSWGDTGWEAHEIQARLYEGNVFYLVKIDNQVVGTVSLAWQDERNWGHRSDNAGYIHQLAVRDGYRGQGLGAQIINWLSSEVLKSGRKYLRLDCDADNEGLCMFYEKNGFIRVGTHKRQDNEMGNYEAALYERSVVT